MRSIFILSAATALCASTAFAQTTQVGVLGASGDPVYSVRVEGSNGVIFNCKPDIAVRDGVRVRECVPEGEDGTVFAGGDGLAVGAAVGVGLVFLAVAASGGDDATATTGTGPSVGVISDIRLKSGVTRIGTTAHDLPLYQFRYTGGSQVFEGVMAQDVLKVMPEAVNTMTSGFYSVNYDMLGIEMRAVK